MKALSAIILASLLSACFSDEWVGFVYPDKANLTIHAAIGNFPTLEECRRSAMSILSVMGRADSGSYECGLNCKSSGELQVCDKTER